MEERKCLFCGADISHLQSSAKYCSANHRVQYYQKQKRRQEKKPIKKIPVWIKKNISKTAVWFFLIILLIFSIPYVFDKGMRIYKDYRVEWQNERLEELEKRFSEMNQEVNAFDENQRLKYYLNVLMKPENEWMTSRDIKLFKKDMLGKDVKLLEN